MSTGNTARSRGVPVFGSQPFQRLFILELEALSRKFHTGVPWELLYAVDVVVIADSLEDIAKLTLGKI